MLTFYRMSHAQYAALASKDPDGIYFLTDTRHICTGTLDYSHGITGYGHVIGGCCAGVTAYSETDGVFSLTLKNLDDDDLDMTKFQVGQSLFLNIPDDADVTNGEDLHYQVRTILTVDAENQIITLDASLLNSNITQLEPDKCFCMVEDPERLDNATSDGDKNFVTGVRAHAHGSWNSVTGMAAEASGIENIASGTSAQAQGTYTLASGNSAHAEGIQTKATGFSAHAQGSSTTASGDTSFAGGTATVASGNNSYAWGANSKAEGNLARANGVASIAAGSYSTADGYQVQTDAVKSHIIGMDGHLEASRENEGAIAFAGGTRTDKRIPFLFKMRRVIANPDYNAELDSEQSGTDSNGQDQYISQPGYSMIYAGRLTAQTLVSDAAEMVLDHDLYARWISNAQSVSLTLQNWDDGDCGEVVFSGELVLPDEWIKHGSMTNNYPQNILQIEKVGDNIFCQLKYKE